MLATAVGGVPEVIDGPPAGWLSEQRSVSGVLKGWHSLPPQSLSLESRRRRYAEQFGWEETTRSQIALFNEVLGAARGL